MDKLFPRRGVLLTVLLSLFLGITGGCATSPDVYPVAVECEKPPLRGETWADIAILSVEQSAAIDICNIRNGVDTYRTKYAESKRASIRVPSPRECRMEGIYVADGEIATGVIYEAHVLDPGEAQRHCRFVGYGTVVGCTVEAAPHSGVYEIYYENEQWIKTHESCHAYYEEMGHMQWYIDSRD